MSALTTGSFPDINIQESEKKEDYHKKWATAILNEAVDGRYEMGYRLMQESYNFYDGTQSGDEYSFLQESENGDNLPAVWINYNSVRSKVDVLLGELSQKGFELRVRAINKDAKSRRMDEKYRIKAKMMMQPDLEMLQQHTGMPVAPVENLPNTEEELDDYIEFEYKEDCERVMYAALNYLVLKYEWLQKRIVAFRDLVITGRCFAKTHIVEGMVTYEVVDPRYMVFDSTSRDDYLRDSSYFGHLEYMPISEAIQRFKLSKKEIEDIGVADGTNNNAFLNIFNADSNSLGRDTSLKYISGTNTNVKVLVFFAQFQDVKRIKRKVSKDKYGTEHFKKVKQNAKGKDIKNYPVKVWRKVTLIAGKVVRDWGLKENMIRSVDDIYDTKSDYVSLAHNFVNGNTISKVDLIKGLQNFKNVSMLNLQLAMNRAGPKGFFYDISQLPDGWSTDDVLYHLKTDGIQFYNSMQNGYSRPNPGLNQFDMTISQSINQYLLVCQNIDKEIDRITGINESRVGQVASASQAVGVTQSAIMSSQLVTEPLFKAFEFFTELLMSNLAGLVKIVFQNNPEAFAPIIGDSGINHLKITEDVHLQDYATFVDVTPPLIGDEQQFQQWLNAALSTQSISIQDALEFVNIKDLQYKIRKLKRIIEKREKEKRDHEQQMMQMQSEQQSAAQQQALAMQSQLAMQEEQAKGVRRKEEIDQTSDNRMREALAKERVKIIGN